MLFQSFFYVLTIPTETTNCMREEEDFRLLHREDKLFHDHITSSHEGRGGEGRGGEGRGGEGRGGVTVIHIVIGMFTSNPMIPQYLNNNLT